MKYKNYFLYLSILIIILAIIRIILQVIYGSFVRGDVIWINDFLGIAVAVCYFIGIIGVWGQVKFGYQFIAITGVVELIPSLHVFVPITFISGVVFIVLGTFGLILLSKVK